MDAVKAQKGPRLNEGVNISRESLELCKAYLPGEGRIHKGGKRKA